MQSFSSVIINLKAELGTSDNAFSLDTPKPLYCPICTTPQNGTCRGGHVFLSKAQIYYVTFLYECTSCKEKYLAIFDVDLKNKNATFAAFYPNKPNSYKDDKLSAISERFIDMYNQALACEDIGNIELAAIGFRSAVEILIKDYAIKELGEDEKTVSKMRLIDAIGNYLSADIASSADVVRILGNDYTHYQRKYPQHDFEVLKQYMNIFIQQVKTMYMIKHPPVARS